MRIRWPAAVGEHSDGEREHNGEPSHGLSLRWARYRTRPMAARASPPHRATVASVYQPLIAEHRWAVILLVPTRKAFEQMVWALASVPALSASTNWVFSVT